MKKPFIFVSTFILLLVRHVSHVRTAALNCSEGMHTVDLADHKADTDNSAEENVMKNDSTEANKNSLNKLFQNIQCTLEKAKPWVAELQQEAERLEEAAKLLGLGILNSFGDFVDKLVEETSEATAKIHNTTAANDGEGNTINSTEIIKEEISQYLCPEGFAADHNGVCVNESIK